MRIYDIAFCVAGFFILGVFVASLKINFLAITMAVALTAVLLLFFGYVKKLPLLFWLAGFSLITIAGAFYYGIWNQYQIQKINIVFDKKINFEGVIIENPERGASQQLVVKLSPPYSGNILVRLQPYPSFDYGDKISFNGIIQNPAPQEYADYLSKDGIFGVVSFPKFELISKNNGSNIRLALFKFKEEIISIYQKSLPAENAAFLSGLNFGEKAEFSQDFKQAMKNSGVMHLVALSGYNITIIVVAISALLGYFVSRRWNFSLTIPAIIIFVAMTGAEASVVRAAIIGFIILLAKQSGRVFSSRNAITLAAFFMILLNPKLLRFDAGFQLSFLALIGIVYLSPSLKKLFRFSNSDFLGFKENFSTTLSAQLAVLPILISGFGSVSIISLLTNVLILEVVPLTMSLGFILAGLGFISYYLSLVFGWFVNLFLFYEIFVIKFFGQVSALQISSLSAVIVILYYSVLVGFILIKHPRESAYKSA